ncbi:interleukin-8-like [Lonchura striata]
MGAPLLPWLLLLLLVMSHSAHAAILEVNGNLSCRCAKTTSEYISPKKYESIEIRPVGSSCRRMEIIIKLRTSGKVCVNPEAPWVKKLLKRIASTRKLEETTEKGRGKQSRFREAGPPAKPQAEFYRQRCQLSDRGRAKPRPRGLPCRLTSPISRLK